MIQLGKVWELFSIHHLVQTILVRSSQNRWVKQQWFIKLKINSYIPNGIKGEFELLSCHKTPTFEWFFRTKSLPAENDIALIELEEPIEFPKDFKPFYLESLEVEEVSEIHKLPKHVSEITFYQDQATTPVNKMKTFTDFRKYFSLNGSWTCKYFFLKVVYITHWIPHLPKREFVATFAVYWLDHHCSKKG